MRSLVTILVLSSLVACAAPPADGPGDDPYGIGVGGKADDFFSPHAFEYVFSGRTTVTLEADLADASEEVRMQRVRELVGLEHIALAYFLTQYLIEKEPRERGHDWGGVGGMAKAGGYREMDIQQVDALTYEFTFEQIVAAEADLQQDLPLGEEGLAEDELHLVIGNPTNEQLAQLESDEEWFRKDPWKGWDPARVTDEGLKRHVIVRVRPERGTPDAWLDYEQLFADGVLRIDLQLGYDYHSQYHRKHARTLYFWLRDELGYHAPVPTFDAFTRDSGPFTKTLNANGRQVTVEIRIFYGKDGGVNDPNTDAGGLVLDQDLRASFATADVVIFGGHSGPFYGFSMANWKRTDEGDLSYLEIESLEMPADKYQIVVADGCDTYQIAAAFARNPAKLDGHNIDVITTTSYGDAEVPYSIMNAISHLTETDSDGMHRPRTLRSLLVDLTEANGMNPLYGIHFVADNPHRHPYADTRRLCDACTRHDQCGAPGNRCVTLPDWEGSFCSAACTDDSGCPRGYGCQRIAAPTAHAIYSFGCVPNDLDCS